MSLEIQSWEGSSAPTLLVPTVVGGRQVQTQSLIKAWPHLQRVKLTVKDRGRRNSHCLETGGVRKRFEKSAVFI